MPRYTTPPVFFVIDYTHIVKYSPPKKSNIRHFNVSRDPDVTFQLVQLNLCFQNVFEHIYFVSLDL